MKSITIVCSSVDPSSHSSLSQLITQSDSIESLISLIGPDQQPTSGTVIEYDTLFSGALIQKLLQACSTEYLLLTLPGENLEWSGRSFERLVQVAQNFGAGLVYSDFREQQAVGTVDHPLLDWQPGSIRDTFDFGGALLLSRTLALRALQRGAREVHSIRWGGLYDLRLKLSEISSIVRLPEMLYTRLEVDSRVSGERIFDYVNPAMREYQIEMERIATSHLRRIGAFLEPEFLTTQAPAASDRVTASIVIPVRNRIGTIKDAVQSALSQETDFAFNVVVVDNHSTDGTTEALKEIAAAEPRVVHLIPERLDLGIGGCWNEAILAEQCGTYAVQLDSDDIYGSQATLQSIIDTFREGGYAMVIGSYRTVDFDLAELPPGLVDHREWTRDNGRNNALRINGLGAPRAFNVDVLRGIGFPNVSYGEDYAVALRISRDYEIGRIYESLYLARRWGGNSDSALPLETMNRYDKYKDWIRTQEISARQRLNGYSD